MKFGTLFLGVLLLNLFALVMIKLRPKLFKVKVFKPMLWNFKLSILPFFILLANVLVLVALAYLSASLGVKHLMIVAYVVFFVGLLIWLVFLPNSGYLITELNLTHRENDEKEVPIWYDIVSTLAFALSGIINALANIVIIQLSFLVFFDPQGLTTLDYAALFFSGLGLILMIVVGIYLGRVVRLNSWDILHLRSFFGKLKKHFSGRECFGRFVLYIVANTTFFLIMYVVLGIPFYFMA